MNRKIPAPIINKCRNDRLARKSERQQIGILITNIEDAGRQSVDQSGERGSCVIKQNMNLDLLPNINNYIDFSI